jgi:hypothetical protein
LSALEALINDCTIGSDAPSVILVTRDEYVDLWTALQPQQRFQDSNAAAAGFKSISINGIPVIQDSHVPSGHVIAINESYLDLYYHPARNFKMEAFQRVINQDVTSAKIYWAGALVCNNPRMSGMMTAIA